MTAYSVWFGVMLCLTAANGRHFMEQSELEGHVNSREDHVDNRQVRDFADSQTRHRRKRWQMGYGYNYPRPANPFYEYERRDYNRNQMELYPEILRLLDEITAYIKRPMPPPQPIYVPYPIPYPVPQACSCNDNNNFKPNITGRFPEMSDPNMNWGFEDSDEDEFVDTDSGDGARPISFDPIVPKRPPARQPPKVDHGSTQAAVTN